jgi:hypothetical protein
MPAHEEEVKEEDAKAEAVVVLGSLQASEGSSVQFGRREQGHAYIAGEEASPITELEGIAIDEHHGAVRGDE